VGRKSRDTDRSARVEQLRRQQASAERRRTQLVIGAAVLVVVVLVGLVVYAINDARSAPGRTAAALAEVGVPAAQASCDPVESAKAEGVNAHVGPGTNDPGKTRVDYSTAPPMFGEHYPQPAYPAAAFYTAADRPAMETLVHNLEHGYTIVWYDESLPQQQQDELRRISDLARELDATGGKFIVTAWDPSYGDFPDGKPVAVSHWGTEDGHRQYCGAVSGAAIQSFVQDFPFTDSPEPNAQ